MKYLFLFLAMSSTSFAQGLYTPQTAIADMMSEPLKFVGRANFLGFNSGGAALNCVYKNSRVYVVMLGCRPTWQQTHSTFSSLIFNRQGGQLSLYLENARGDYDVNEAGPNHKGAWNITYTQSPPIVGELNINQFIDYYNAYEQRLQVACSYGVMSPVKVEPALHCSAELDSSQWSVDVEEFWQRPFENKFREAHDMILKGPRK